MQLGSMVSTIVAVSVMSIGVVGCGGGAGSGPEGTVNRFFQSVKAKKYEQAVSCYAPSQVSEPGASEKMTGYLKSSMEQKGGIASFTVGEAAVDGDEAKVSYTVNYKGGGKDESRVTCLKEDGKWFLSIN